MDAVGVTYQETDEKKKTFLHPQQKWKLVTCCTAVTFRQDQA